LLDKRMNKKVPKRSTVPKPSVGFMAAGGKPSSGQQSDPLLSVLSTRGLSNEILRHRLD
jgi:hypothetical protein